MLSRMHRAYVTTLLAAALACTRAAAAGPLPPASDQQLRLTKLMSEVLKAADLQLGEINNVPMRTMDGLQSRALVTGAYRRTSTSGGRFPRYGHVKLTPAGIRAARTIQGYKMSLGGPMVAEGENQNDRP
jgi:hypothetical protein